MFCDFHIVCFSCSVFFVNLPKDNRCKLAASFPLLQLLLIVQCPCKDKQQELKNIFCLCSSSSFKPVKLILQILFERC